MLALATPRRSGESLIEGSKAFQHCHSKDEAQARRACLRQVQPFTFAQEAEKHGFPAPRACRLQTERGVAFLECGGADGLGPQPSDPFRQLAERIRAGGCRYRKT